MYDSPQRAKPSIRPTDVHLKRMAKAAASPKPKTLGTVNLDLSKFPLWNPATGLPSPEDVRQGGVGDCWAMATLAALAATAPEHLKSLIKPLPNGDFRVRLDKDYVVGPLIHCWNRGHGTAAKALYSGFLKATWVAVMEKALVKRDPKGKRQGDTPDGPSYDRLDGGQGNLLMDILSKEPATVVNLRAAYHPSLVVAQVERGLAEGRLVLASRTEPSGGGHGYAVIARTTDGFQLYNPHGRYVDVPLQEFLSTTFALAISGKFKRSKAAKTGAASPAPARSRTPSPTPPAGPVSPQPTPGPARRHGQGGMLRRAQPQPPPEAVAPPVPPRHAPEPVAPPLPPRHAPEPVAPPLPPRHERRR